MPEEVHQHAARCQQKPQTPDERVVHHHDKLSGRELGDGTPRLLSWTSPVGDQRGPVDARFEALGPRFDRAPPSLDTKSTWRRQVNSKARGGGLRAPPTVGSRREAKFGY